MLFNGHSVISGVGSYFPDQIITSYELLEELQTERRFGLSHDYLDTKVGIHERRYALDSMKPSELAILAAEHAINDSGVEPTNLDAIIYCGITGDQIEPSTAHNIQAALGASNAICRDVSNACHGFSDGMHTADMMIAGGANHVLVVTAELTRSSRLIFPALKKEKEKDAFMQMIGGLTVGDGGGAMVLSQKQDQAQGIHKVNIQSCGQYAHLCRSEILDGGFKGNMAMVKISGIMVKLRGRLLKSTLTALNWDKGSIDHLIMHQVGQRPFTTILKLTEIDKSNAPKTLDRFGNITTVTIPANYAQLKQAGRLKRGDRCLIMATGNGMIISQTGLTV